MRGHRPGALLAGVRVVELAGAGPAPFCSMVLADFGADVIRIDRPVGRTVDGGSIEQLNARGKRSVSLDLRDPDAVDAARRIIDRSDVLIEGFRPGVAERLGLGPEACRARNQRLVYVRCTGWGQTGPLADRPGHDINYLAISGVLHALGPAESPPLPPLNLIGDFGGGGMLALVGVLAALVERERSGEGQIVDVAMVDGIGLLATLLHELLANGMWSVARGTNLFDGSAPFYRTYETADGRFVAVGAIEPAFYEEMLSVLDLEPRDLPTQFDREQWPILHAALAARFRTRTRDEWAELAHGTDSCITPVLAFDELASHPYHTARDSLVSTGGAIAPFPAPRFSRNPVRPPSPAVQIGADSEIVLLEVGLSQSDIDALRARGSVAGPNSATPTAGNDASTASSSLDRRPLPDGRRNNDSEHSRVGSERQPPDRD